jgi:hypothetical protein
MRILTHHFQLLTTDNGQMKNMKGKTMDRSGNSGFVGHALPSARLGSYIRAKTVFATVYRLLSPFVAFCHILSLI